jgi:hypothetical protein
MFEEKPAQKSKIHCEPSIPPLFRRSIAWGNLGTDALAAAGSVSIYNAEVDVPKPWSLAPVPAAAALPRFDSQFLPIQFNSPQDLGVGKLLVEMKGQPAQPPLEISGNSVA